MLKNGPIGKDGNKSPGTKKEKKNANDLVYNFLARERKKKTCGEHRIQDGGEVSH